MPLSNHCPFHSSNAISVPNFVDRRLPLRRVAGRTARGESTAIVGEPRTGKTSLLLYLAASETQTDLYGESARQLLFSFLDSQTLGGQFTQAQFWEQMLTPIREQLVGLDPDSPLARQYQICHDNGYGSTTLEALFRHLHALDRRLVLLLDEFDQLLHHPILNSAEFFGGLRSLASRSNGALTLIIASRLPLTRLNHETQPFNPTGSPFFNIFSEIVLGDFPKEDVAELLRKAGDRFSPLDRRVIRHLAGGHPFLLQASAALMWEAYDEGVENLAERRRYVGQRLYREQRQHFAETWRNWTSETRQVFSVVALANVSDLLAERNFRLDNLIKNLPNLAPELGDLEQTGLLAREPLKPVGWRVTQEVMLWWLADELIRALRSESAFGQWLQTEQLEGRWTRGQRQEVSDAVRGLGQGATGLIEKFVAAFGAGVAMSPG